MQKHEKIPPSRTHPTSRKIAKRAAHTHTRQWPPLSGARLRLGNEPVRQLPTVTYSIMPIVRIRQCIVEECDPSAWAACPSHAGLVIIMMIVVTIGACDETATRSFVSEGSNGFRNRGQCVYYRSSDLSVVEFGKFSVISSFRFRSIVIIWICYEITGGLLRVQFWERRKMI